MMPVWAIALILLLGGCLGVYAILEQVPSKQSWKKKYRKSKRK
jgi:hypothetical protein